DDAARHLETERPILGATELVPSQEHVLQTHALRQAIGPAAERELSNRPLEPAKAVHRSRGQLAVAEHADLRNCVQPNLRDGLPPLADLENLARASDREPVPRHVERS